MNIRVAKPGQPLYEDIQTIRNDTFQWSFRGWAKDGTPFNFEGYTFDMQVKKNANHNEAVLVIPTSSFTAVWDTIGEENDRLNVIELVHPKEQMDITPGTYVYDIQMTSPDGVITQTVYTGKFTVRQDNTR